LPQRLPALIIVVMQLSWIFLVLRSTAMRAITISTAIFRTSFHQTWFNCELPLFSSVYSFLGSGWSKHSFLLFFINAEIFMEILLLEEFLIQYLRWKIWKHCRNSNSHSALIYVPFTQSLFFFALITLIPILLNHRNLGKNHLNGQLTDMFSQLPKLSTL